MRFKFEVEIEVERSEGKFATRDELAEQIREALESADLGSLSGDNGGEYNTTAWDVNEVDADPPKRKRAPSTVGLTPDPGAASSPQGASGPQGGR